MQSDKLHDADIRLILKRFLSDPNFKRRIRYYYDLFLAGFRMCADFDLHAVRISRPLLSGMMRAMMLATHALVGAAAAEMVPSHPVLAFCAGFISHFAIDALPHWDYGRVLRSLRKNVDEPIQSDMVIGKDFILDLAILGFDSLFGVVLSLVIFSVWLFHVSPLVVLLGACGGLLPDTFHFIYYKTHARVLAPIQRFHVKIQRSLPPHISPALGILWEASLVAIIIGVELLLRR